jgi:osmotically-inducible protein OsmY
MEHTDDEPKAYLVAHVREALARDGRTNELHVDVTVAGRRVFLTGEVASEERRQAVRDVVSELLPDHDVHNETTVPQLAEPEAPEKLS